MSDEVIERLRAMGFRVTKKTTNDLRTYLKSKGWRRGDRATGPNQSIEKWYHRDRPLGVSLRAAARRQLKIDGLIT